VAILKWNTPPSGDQEDRRAHIIGHGEGVSLQHAAFGDKVQGGAQINTLNPNVELAGRWLSTAPYRGDETNEPAPPPSNPYGYRDKTRLNMCMAKDDTCGAFATEASGRQWCIFHTPKDDQ
jgi:hypothetical protein